MEIQGFTPVDTIYGFVGHAIGFRLSSYLIWQGFLVFFVVAAGFIRLYYTSSMKGSFTELAVYPLYVFFLLFFLYPIEVTMSAPRAPGNGASDTMASAEKVQVPRVLAYVCALTDPLQQALIREIKQNVGSTLREWERISAVNAKARIYGKATREDLAYYLKYCYWPTMAQDDAPKGDPWELVPLGRLPVDEWLLGRYQEINLSSPRMAISKYPIACTSFHTFVANEVEGELQSEKVHAMALSAFSGANVSDAEAFSFYRRRILYNEIYVLQPGQAAAVRAALPEYSLTDPNTMSAQIKQTSNYGELALSWAKNIPSMAASAASALDEWWTQNAMGTATYYRVSAMAPHIYGMTVGLLFMLFPIAGLMSLWPKWSGAITNFMKILISVKMWPILWALLSGILSSRNLFDGTNPNGYDSGLGNTGVFPALCSMYLIVPTLSFMMVNIAHHAAGGALGMLIAGSEGASMGSSKGMAGELSGAAGGVIHGGVLAAKKGWNVVRRGGSDGGGGSGGGSCK